MKDEVEVSDPSAGVEERVNLQRDASKAKPYQVRQVRAVIVKYRLVGEE